MEYKLTETSKGTIKAKEEFTPARRYSFLVGLNESTHTAQRQLVPILSDDKNNPTFNNLEEAFRIEKVTKEFFEEYRRLFLELKEALDTIIKKDSKIRQDFKSKNINTVDFAKKLLGQIVFLYFLQKKGWFGVARNADWGTGPKNFLRQLFEKKIVKYKNFFNDILEPLFYEALAVERSDNFYSRFNCKIPFLNGGLFDPINNYDWVHTDILIPNEIFSNTYKTKQGDIGTGILDVFDRYNFTVKEDEPLEKEVAVDPEMLGKVFENLLEVKDRKSKGTYYTPREIVHYMCQQSLIYYLASELEGKVNKKDIETLIRYGETAVEHEMRVVNKGKETSKYSFKLPETIRKYAKLIDEKLASIYVCDPAVGSGAFPVGMMNEIVRTRNVLTNYIKEKDDRTIYNFKRHAIQNCLYGVDIDLGAVEIAKLRLWLSLIVDEEDIKQIKPLPNLDYKIVQGNSLLGVEKNIFNFELFNKLEELKPFFFNETDVKKKQLYKKQIDKLISQLTNGQKVFDFEVYFSEVFHEKKGFDVVIANPPYIGEKGHKDTFQMIAKGYLGRFYQRRMDIFYFFFHLALNITHEYSTIAFITTNYYITASGAVKLRKDFKERAIIQTLVNFNELKLFESALGQHNMITILQRGKDESAIAQTCITQKQGFATSEILQSILDGNDSDTHYYTVQQSDLYDGDEYYIRLTGKNKTLQSPIQVILDKITKGSVNLGFFCNVNQGIVTGADRVSKKHIKKYKIDSTQLGKGIFVLKPDELKLEGITTDSDHVKPWYKNSDIKKFWTNRSVKEYVLYFKDTKTKQPIESTIKKHFESFKKLLIDRLSVCKKNKFQWNIVSKWINRGEYYLLFYPRKQEIFEKPKIVAPQRSSRNTFGYNEIPWYAASDVFFITEKDRLVSLKYILALINSKLYFLWLYHRGKRKGETLELIAKPLSEIPIKKISKDEQKLFINIVNKILSITKDKDYLENPAKQAKVKEYERQIDQLVYKLYGLTEEEIKIVEGYENNKDKRN